MPQTFLNAGEHGLVVAGLDVDDPVGGQACLGQRWCEQVRASDNPEHLALGAGGNAGCKQGGGSAVDSAVTAACDFVQRAEC